MQTELSQLKQAAKKEIRRMIKQGFDMKQIMSGVKMHFPSLRVSDYKTYAEGMYEKNEALKDYSGYWATKK